MLNGRRHEIGEQLRGAVKDAGTLLTAIAAIAALALGIAAAALFVASRALHAARAA